MNKARGSARVRNIGCCLLLPAAMAGCAHRDAVDTPVAWWHQLEGGAIAQQRPPPPGVDDPYPLIGTTPAAAPKVASTELRHSVTEQLVEQRNLSARLNAHDPLPPPAATLPAARAARPMPAPAANPAQSSATLDAADAPPAPAPALTTHAAAVPAAVSAAASPAASAADLALPAVVSGTDAGTPVVLPAIPDAPPPPPGLPGLSMPPPPSYVPPPRPHYALAQEPGDVLQFAAGSDVLGSGQSGALRQIAAHRGAGSVFVHGYGEAGSDSPQDQAQALTLAALRARSVADALERQGVPASAIRIRADAFGRGARAGLVD